MFWAIFTCVTCIKILLIPAYHSTDFEVHRNWLAITHNLPIGKWYFENTSEWTLDYPPLFAWFEFGLSHLAKFTDAKMLQVENLNYASDQTVLFQRFSVIVADFVFFYGVYRCCKWSTNGWKSKELLPILLSANVGLLMVDHIHFQYNGFLLGLLLISVAEICEGRMLKGALYFATLLNLKHIFIYVAPSYFIYLLRNHCFASNKATLKNFRPSNFLKLSGAVLGVFFITYAPFLDHIQQVISRLFPFKRGLCHAYWAPNFWALYNVADKTAYFIGSRFGANLNSTIGSMTGGLVKESSHIVLPNVSPLATMLLTLAALLPVFCKLWTRGMCRTSFLRSIVLSALTSFLFGWHVHEKAILIAIIPLGILAVSDKRDARIFLILSTVGHFSLFPLLFPPELLPIKTLMFLIYAIYAFRRLPSAFRPEVQGCNLPLLNFAESAYILGLGLVHGLQTTFPHIPVLGPKFPFLPLMLISVYCSLGVVYSWGLVYKAFMTGEKGRKNSTSSANRKPAKQKFSHHSIYS